MKKKKKIKINILLVYYMDHNLKILVNKNKKILKK